MAVDVGEVADVAAPLGALCRRGDRRAGGSCSRDRLVNGVRAVDVDGVARGGGCLGVVTQRVLAVERQHDRAAGEEADSVIDGVRRLVPAERFVELRGAGDVLHAERDEADVGHAGILAVRTKITWKLLQPETDIPGTFRASTSI